MNMMLDEAFIKATNNAHRKPLEHPHERRVNWWGRRHVKHADNKG